MPPGVSTALDVFIGYLLLDVWAANQDRHHENWGAIVDVEHGDLVLAPTFDHGAALARNLLDAERIERLTTRDANRSLNVFATKARSAFFDSATDSRTLLLIDSFQMFARRAPAAACVWLNRLQAVNLSDVSGILRQVPNDRMSDICREFTLRLLEVNRQRLLDLELS